VEHLKAGGVVTFATDTLFGLGADVLSPAGLEKVFEIKGRPQHMPLPVLVSAWEQVHLVAQADSPMAQRLARLFWPGALTLVLKKHPQTHDLVTAGGDTVAVRMPGHSVPRALAEGLGRPITGTSANRSGDADIPDFATLQADLGHLVDYVVNVGPEPAGVSSTVVDLTGGEPRLLRAGAVDFQEILAGCR
jgi:L-threonylcarbamoyladenylate synthase